ncbi:hypothetical protein HDZ31DRAFT_85331 [Schizophyllum fasciatum]
MDRLGVHPKKSQARVARAVGKAVAPSTNAIGRAVARTTTLAHDALHSQRSDETVLARLQAQQPQPQFMHPQPPQPPLSQYVPRSGQPASWAAPDEHEDGYGYIRAQSASFPPAVRHLARTIQPPALRTAPAPAPAPPLDPIALALAHSSQSDALALVIAPAPASARRGMNDLPPKRLVRPELEAPAMQRMILNQEVALAAALTKDGCDATELFTSIQQNLVNHASRASPKTIAGRNLILARWMILFRHFYAHRRHDSEAWDPDVVEQLAPLFLEFTLRFVLATRKRFGQLKSSTVQWWMSMLCQTIIRYVTDPTDGDRPCGVQLLVERNLFDILSDQVVSLSNQMNLDRSRTRKLYFGLWEVYIMIANVLHELKTSKNPLYHVQSIEKVLFGFYLGIRPTTLGPSTKEGIEKNQFLACGDIQLFKEGPGQHAIHIHLRCFKGHFQSHSDRPQSMIIRSVQRPEFAPFDLPSWVIPHLLSIGAIEGFDNWDDYDASNVYERRIKATFKHTPFFHSMTPGARSFTNEPCMSRHFSDNLRHLCYKSLLPLGGLYVLRRGSAQELVIASNSVNAAMTLNHRPNGYLATLHEHYTPGTESIDYTPLRLATDPNIADAQHRQLDAHRWQFSQCIDALARIASEHVSYVVEGTAPAIKASKKKSDAAANARADEHPDVTQALRERDDLVTAYVDLFESSKPIKTDSIASLGALLRHANGLVKQPHVCFKAGVDPTEAEQALQTIRLKHKQYKVKQGSTRAREKDDSARLITRRALENRKDGTIQQRQQARAFLQQAPSALTAQIVEDYKHQATTSFGSEEQVAHALELDDAEAEQVLAETHRARELVHVRRANTRARRTAAAPPAAGSVAEEDSDSDEEGPEAEEEDTHAATDGREDSCAPQDEDWPAPEPGRTLNGLTCADAVSCMARLIWGYLAVNHDETPARRKIEGANNKASTYQCLLCAPLRAHMREQRIRGDGAPSLMKDTFPTSGGLNNHIKTTHNRWRTLILDIKRDGLRLACPGCHIHKGNFDRLIEHMRFACKKRDEYEALFQEHREIGHAVRGHPRPKSTLKGKGRRNTEQQVAGDESDDWNDWDDHVDPNAETAEVTIIHDDAFCAHTQDTDSDSPAPSDTSADLTLPFDQQATLDDGYRDLSQILESQYNGLGADALSALYQRSQAALADAGGRIDIDPAEWQAALAHIDTTELPFALDVDRLFQYCQDLLSKACSSLLYSISR